MKKFLLFLSCFLTTWCSVQAANPQITSATYNESSSTFSVSYTSNSSNNALMMVCKATGPVGSNVKLNASPATVDLPITARAGEYNLVLFSNGSPCYEKKNIIVTKYGHINSAKASSTSSVTINYSMFHAETSSYPDKSYLKIVGVGTHKITNVKNGSYTWTGLKLTAGQTYTCEIYVDGVCKHTYKFTAPPTYGDITSVTNVSTSSVTVKYTMRNAATSNNSYLKIGSYKHNITNVENGIYKWTGLKLTAGQTYTCEIYVDGVRKDTYTFTVPPTYGDITSVTNVSTSSVTVKYTMRNAATSNNSYLKIGSYKHNITNVENGIYNWTGLNLTPGATYTCEIYVDGVRKDTYTFTVPGGGTTDAVKLTPMGGNRLKIDFTLSSPGYVKFNVHTYSLTGGKGESKPVDYGQCDTCEGTKEVDVPYYTGYVGYAVELIKNGTSVNGASVTAYNR